MKRVRITYPGAFHHIMNRGHGGEDILDGDKNKILFLYYMADASKKLKIKILAYCIMDNHFHLIIENTSGKMSEFVKRFNSIYARYYCKISGRKGYVFQSRFKSTLIEKDAYLVKSIVYLLQNPVRAGVVQNSEDYKWSSVNSYYLTNTANRNEILDIEFVKEIFGTKEAFLELLHSDVNKGLPIRSTKYGDILGSESFFKSAFKKYDRRLKLSEQSIGTKRNDDYYFDPIEKVLWEFERKRRMKLGELDISTIKGKRLRGELLVLLKDKTGLTYREIGTLDIFGDLNLNSLRSIYRNSKRRLNY